MNDIEILENFIRTYKELDEKSTDFYFNKAEIPIEIIENLIQENKELRIQISARETVVDELKERLKEAKEYIEKEMYIDDNPTICGDEEDTIIELPISLNLFNEDLRKLLELLDED